jgi:hypothetical protein
VNRHDPVDAGANRLIFLADCAEAGAVLEANDSRGERRADDRIQARRRSVANVCRGRKSASGKEARDDDQ